MGEKRGVDRGRVQIPVTNRGLCAGLTMHLNRRYDLFATGLIGLATIIG